MRWLVFFLLVLNGLTFAWFAFQEQNRDQLEQQQAKQFDFTSVPPLQLLSEMAEAERKKRDTRGLIRPMVATSVDAGEESGSDGSEIDIQLDAGVAGRSMNDGQCLLLGPFPEVISARQVRLAIEAAGMTGKIVEIVNELPAINWVFIPPLPDRVQALAVLRQLQQDGIDSFLVSEGEYENAISLGFFSSDKAADSVIEQRKAQGYDAHQMLRTRERKSYWTALNGESSRRFDDAMLARLGGDRHDVKKREISCDEVALLPAIH